MGEEIISLETFLADNHSLMIAPAGHGKTFCISECVKIIGEGGCVLILTHTHAGIASIKSKMSKANVPSKYYHIETIMGFIQHYVTSLFGADALPEINDNSYYNTLLQIGKNIFSSNLVKTILFNSYKCLFVDEYQDCSLEQNDIILEISEILPAHLFGDEMQGIFSFNGQIPVSFKDDLPSFNQYRLLTIPWRWKSNGNNEQLGYEILKCRKSLESNPSEINIHNNPQSSFYVLLLDDRQKDYFQTVGKYIRSLPGNSILVIVPSGKDYGTISERVTIRNRLGLKYSFQLIEALDDNKFYSCAKSADTLIREIKDKHKPIKQIAKLLESLTFTKTDINEWITDNKIKSKRDMDKSIIALKLQEEINRFISIPSSITLLSLLIFAKVELKMQLKRENLYYTLQKVIKDSITNQTSIYTEMVSYKNRIRRTGRTIKGKCIATTLLTKGLEFDHVVIIGANKFEDHKNFYVAISRACKSLHIFTNSMTLHFNKYGLQK